MSRNTILAFRLREVLLQGQWIANTNYKAQLLQVCYSQATHQIEGFNTIAALVFHINYYIEGLLLAFDTGQLEISDKYSFDFISPASELEWKALVAKLIDHASQFADMVEQMPDSQYDQPFVDEKYGSIGRNIEGVIEHCYYHLGQIVMLRKMIDSV